MARTKEQARAAKLAAKHAARKGPPMELASNSRKFAPVTDDGRLRYRHLGKTWIDGLEEREEHGILPSSFSAGAKTLAEARAAVAKAEKALKKSGLAPKRAAELKAELLHNSSRASSFSHYACEACHASREGSGAAACSECDVCAQTWCTPCFEAIQRPQKEDDDDEDDDEEEEEEEEDEDEEDYEREEKWSLQGKRLCAGCADKPGRRREWRLLRQAELARVCEAEEIGFAAQHAKYLEAVKAVEELSQYACWECQRARLVVKTRSGYPEAGPEEMVEIVRSCRECDQVCCERCMESRRGRQCCTNRMVDRGLEHSEDYET